MKEKGIRMVRMIGNDQRENRKTMRLTLKADDVKLRKFNRAVQNEREWEGW